MKLKCLAGAVAACGAVIGTIVGAAPARADWRVAETPSFRIYSERSENELRRYARNLEIYNYILRQRFRLPDEPAAYKLPIFLVNESGLRTVSEGLGRVGGVYFTTSEGMFALALHEAEDDALLHEYFHHFSFQAGALSVAPGWMIEGLAEYYMTAEIRADQVEVGHYNEGRAYSLLHTPWISMQDLLTKRAGEVRPADRPGFYAQAWLLTHWFTSDPERNRRLVEYIRLVGDGVEPLEAMESATGLDPDALRAELRDYMRSRLMGTRYDFPAREVEVQVTRLPDAVGDLLLLGQRLKVGVPEEDRAETVERVRRAAARHPDALYPQLQLGHAELHMGDAAEGERLLLAVLERDPANVEALQLMATRRLEQADETAEDPEPLRRQARAFLARAYEADPDHYFTLLLIARSRIGAPGYPNDNDLLAWTGAFQLAPQLPESRIGLAQALMMVDRHDEAAVLLRPLANAPHGGGAAAAAAALLRQAEAGVAPTADVSLDEVEPETPPDDEA